MNLQQFSILLSIVAIFLVVYKSFINPPDKFEQIQICDYDSPDPSGFCKSITKGCGDILKENKNLSDNIKQNCTNLPTNTRDLINKAIECDDTNNKLIMNTYVKKEVCSQIKNLPTNEEEIISKLSTEVVEPNYKPNDIEKDSSLYYLSTEAFAPF